MWCPLHSDQCLCATLRSRRTRHVCRDEAAGGINCRISKSLPLICIISMARRMALCHIRIHSKSNLPCFATLKHQGTLTHYFKCLIRWSNLGIKFCFSIISCITELINNLQNLQTKMQHTVCEEQNLTWAGNLDSPLHFLSSHAVGSMFEPPKLAA